MAATHASWIAALLCSAALARAQSAPSPEQADVAVTYGMTVRNGTQQMAADLLEYQGATFSDVTLSGSYFASDLFGLRAGIGRESFALTNNGTDLAHGALFRGALQAALRRRFSFVEGELRAGYGLSQIPSLGVPSAPMFLSATRNAALIGLAARFAPTPAMELEVSGEYPLALSVTDPGSAGARVSSTGFSAGAALRYFALRLGNFHYGLGLHYELVSNRVSSSQETATELLHRVLLSLEGRWDFPAKSARAAETSAAPVRLPRGAVQLTVRDGSSAARIANARIRIASREPGSEPQTGQTSTDGTFTAIIALGSVAVHVEAEGYLAQDLDAAVERGTTTEVSVELRRAPPAKLPHRVRRRGDLTIQVADRRTGAPIAAAKVHVLGDDYFSSSNGDVVLVELKPGPVEISVKADGYKPATEIGQVVAATGSTVTVELDPAD